MSNQYRKLRMEQMEDRQMMAGDVSAYVSKGGLFLNESAAQVGFDNAVIISQLTNGKIRVEGGVAPDGVKSLINGAASQEFTMPLMRSLTVNFGGGRDSVEFAALGQIAKFNNVTLNLGAASAVGNADNDVISIGKLETRGSLSIFTGAGADTLIVKNSTIGDGTGVDNLLIRTGAGADYVNLWKNVQVRGNLDIQTYDSSTESDIDWVAIDQSVSVAMDGNLRLGGGDDHFVVGASTPLDIVHTEVALHVYGSLSVDAGAGNDQISMAAAYIGTTPENKLIINTGAGADSIDIDNRWFYFANLEIRTYGAFQETDADHVQIQNAFIFGYVDVRFGCGADQFFITDPADAAVKQGINVTGSMHVDTGGGDDQVHIEGTSIGTSFTDDVYYSGLSIYTGAGQDIVLVDFSLIPAGGGNYLAPDITGDVDIQTYTSITENDADQVRIQAEIHGNLSVRLGGGDDLFRLEGFHVGGDVNFAADGGNDTAYFAGTVDDLFARMGEGNDVLTIDLLYADTVSLLGEGGTDRLINTGYGVSIQSLTVGGWEAFGDLLESARTRSS